VGEGLGLGLPGAKRLVNAFEIQSTWSGRSSERNRFRRECWKGRLAEMGPYFAHFAPKRHPPISVQRKPEQKAPRRPPDPAKSHLAYIHGGWIAVHWQPGNAVSHPLFRSRVDEVAGDPVNALSMKPRRCAALAATHFVDPATHR
jgi:hypothetical protein